jgi:hypothetical protein
MPQLAGPPARSRLRTPGQRGRAVASGLVMAGSDSEDIEGRAQEALMRWAGDVVCRLSGTVTGGRS